jgi:uncharacterized membrane protein
LTDALALVALVTLRSRAGIFVVWIFNIVGFVDLLNAFYTGIRLGVSEEPGIQGAAYYIPSFYVPLLIVTHLLVFWLLLRKDPSTERQ